MKTIAGLSAALLLGSLFSLFADAQAQGCRDVVDADLPDFFGSIPHAEHDEGSGAPCR